MNFSEVTAVSITDSWTQTWYDANSLERALCSPDGSRQPWRNYAILDPSEHGISAARTVSTKFLRYPERGRSGSMVAFGNDKDMFIANFCKQSNTGVKTLMLSYAMRKEEDNRKRPLQCSRCEGWIGQWSLPLKRWPDLFTFCEICMDTLCEFCSDESVRKPTVRIQRMIEDPAVYKEKDHWAMTLNRSLFTSRENLILDVFQILDLHREGKVQWRRKDFSQKEMNKRSWVKMTTSWTHILFTDTS